MYATLELILEQMKEKRVTAYAVEDVLGVPYGSFSNWKRGKGNSFYEHIDRIADQLGVTTEFLIRGDENTQYALSRQEMVLVEGSRKLSNETKDVVLKNVRLQTCG